MVGAVGGVGGLGLCVGVPSAMATRIGSARETHNATTAVTPPPVCLCLVVGPAQCSRVGARGAGMGGPVGGVSWLGLGVGVPSAKATHIGSARVESCSRGT